MSKDNVSIKKNLVVSFHLKGKVAASLLGLGQGNFPYTLFPWLSFCTSSNLPITPCTNDCLLKIIRALIHGITQELSTLTVKLII